MLKANSKKARQNLMEYIREYAENAIMEYHKDGEQAAEKNGFFNSIYQIFREEEKHNLKWYRTPESEIFKEWAQGLPLNGLFCYYCNRSAVDDLGAILEETEEEKSRFTESQAEEMLTRLIYTRVKSEAAREEEERR